MLLQLSLATIMVVTIAIVHLTGLAILTRVLRSHSRVSRVTQGAGASSDRQFRDERIPGAQLCTGMAHPTGFEPVASAFGGQRSIQLSYGCVGSGLSDASGQRQGVRKRLRPSWSRCRADPTIIPT